MQYKYLRPATLDEALHNADEGATYIAGGTDVMVHIQQGTSAPQVLIDLSGIKSLTGISVSDQLLKIGAMTTLSELTTNVQILETYPLIATAARSIATPVIRHTATIAGNLLCENRCTFYDQSEWWRESVGYCLKCDGDICIATGGRKACFSKSVSDLAPALLAMNATITIAGPEGTRTVAITELYSGDGVVPFNLGKGEIITCVNLPLTKKTRTWFRKLRPRKSLDFSSLTVAIAVNDTHISVGLGSVDPRPILIRGDTAEGCPPLIQAALKNTRVIDNDVYSRPYRRRMIQAFINEGYSSLFTTDQ